MLDIFGIEGHIHIRKFVIKKCNDDLIGFDLKLITR